MKVEYPKELTQKNWDNKKPLLAKAHKTGISAKLKALKEEHDKIEWDKYAPDDVDINKVVRENQKKNTAILDEWEKSFPYDLKPLADDAKEIEKIAGEWAKKFQTMKTIPSSASQEAKRVADAAKTYNTQVNSFKRKYKDYLLYLIKTQYRK